MFSHDVESLSSLIKKSYDSNEVLHLKNFTDLKFFWEDILKILDYKYQNAKIGEEENPPNVNRIKSFANGNYAEIVKNTDNFHFHIWSILSSRTIDDYIYNISENFLKTFIYFIDYLKYTNETGLFKTVVNFVGNEAIMPVHKDYHSTIFIQCVGSVSYKIYEGIDGETEVNLIENIRSDTKFESITLNPGDVMFIPKGKVHQVIATEPRASLLLDLGYS